MNKIFSITFLLFTILYSVQGQDYSETFSIPSKGILSGPCEGNLGISCISHDFSGVNWTIEGNLSGIDSEPFATNNNNQLVVSDIDEEACWVSPELEITAATAGFSVDLTWLGYDPDTGDGADYIDVEFTTDGGSNWETIPNLVGGGTHTIEYISGDGSDGQVTINRFNISGPTLQIRVCIDHNSAAETTTISNVLAFGAALPGAGADCDLEVSSVVATDENCPGADDGSLTISATTSQGPITYRISGPVTRSNDTGLFTGLPPGSYDIAVSDDALLAGTCTVDTAVIIGQGVDITPPTATAPADISLACLADLPAADPASVTDATDDCQVPCTTEPWINEFHYDNDGTDTGEFIEIAGPAGTDLSNYSIYLYDGSTREWYVEIFPTGVIDDEQNGFGALSFSSSTFNLQNQTEGIALVKNETTVIEFLSYEGSFIAINGPASGMTSVDVGVSEPATQAIGESLSRIGAGNTGTEFSFADQIATPGSLNGDQTIIPCPENEVMVSFVRDLHNGGVGSAADPLIITRTYRVTDGAGNFADVSQKITVIDPEAPTALCQPALAVEVDASGLALLEAAMFDMGSFDNCGMVSLSLERDTLTCDELGDQVLSLLVTDEAGLTASCTTTVTVTATEEICPTVGIRDRYRQIPGLPLYPNPANQIVTIDLSGVDTNKGTVDILMVNALGQRIYQYSIVKNQEQTHRLNTTGFAAGVYYIQVRTAGSPLAAGRLIIEH
jgi:hypothetical protein